VTRAVTGTSTNRALLTMADCQGCGGGSGPPQPLDFGKSGIAVTRSMVLVNLGGATATGIALSGVAAPFTLTVNNCVSGTLAPGASCDFTLTFTPPGPGISAGTVKASYGDATGGLPAVSRSLTGTGTAGALLSISDCDDFCGGGGGGTQQAFDFGTVGSVVTHTFIVRNIGASPATLLTVVGLSAPFSVSGTTCAAPLASGATCQVTVRFTPSGDVTSTATLRLGFSDAGGAEPDVTRALTATSTSRARLSVSDCQGCGGGGSGPSSTDFGTTGIAASRVFTLTNIGAQPATTLSVGMPAAPFSVSQNGCAAPLAPQASCSFTVTFTPPAAPGGSSGTLTVAYGDAVGALPSLAQGLTGTAGDARAVDPQRLRELRRRRQQPGPVQLRHLGRDDAEPVPGAQHRAQTATGLNVAALSPPFLAGSCAGPLAPGASCTVQVSFSPTMNGAFSATLSVSYGDAGGQLAPVTRAMTGTGTTHPQLSISDGCCGGGGGGPNGPPPYDFGTWGVALKHVFQVFNSGGGTATAVLPAVAAPFSVTSNGCATGCHRT